MQIFVNLPTDRKSELTPHHEYYAALFDILSSTNPMLAWSKIMLIDLAVKKCMTIFGFFFQTLAIFMCHSIRWWTDNFCNAKWVEMHSGHEFVSNTIAAH